MIRQATRQERGYHRVSRSVVDRTIRFVVYFASQKAVDVKEIDPRRLDVYRAEVRKTPLLLRVD